MAHPPRTLARTKAAKRNETRERHDCPCTVVHAACLLFYCVPSFFLVRLPSRLHRCCPAASLPSVCLPPLFVFLSLSFSLSLFLSLLPCPSFTASLSLRNPLYPRRGSFLPLGSPCEIGHRTTLDELPTSPRRVPVPPAKRSAAFGSRARVNHFSERVIKKTRRCGGGNGGHSTRPCRSSRRRFRLLETFLILAAFAVS